MISNIIYILYILVCGEHIDIVPNNEVEITTPNFPDKYPNRVNCTWTFCSVNPNIIVLDFFIFQLEQDSDCDSFDYVNIYDGKLISTHTSLIVRIYFLKYNRHI
jgi:hypothetical protein